MSAREELQELEGTLQDAETVAASTSATVEDRGSGSVDKPVLKRAASEDLDHSSGKRQKVTDDEAGAGSTSVQSTSRVIVPTLLSHKSPTPGPAEAAEEDPDATDEETYIPGPPPPPQNPPILPETYEILPPAQRINPATSLGELLIRNQASTSTSNKTPSPDGLDAYREQYNFDTDDYDFDYLPPPLQPVPEEASTSNDAAGSSCSTSARPVVDLTEAPSPPAIAASASTASTPLPFPPGGSLGSTLTSAIVIGDSPTPPLRPLASPKARMEAFASGRCNVLGGENETKAEASPEKDEVKVTLGELVCPVCLGPPTPLVFTECGHAFCGPCLHSALTSQPITQDTLRALPNVAGKDLEGTCPVCRHPLAGGWGKALRGAILRMAEIEVPC